MIALQDNLPLIRSGQDCSETAGPGRDFFLNKVEPALRAGMDFPRDDGRAIGCFTNRYMEVVDEQEGFIEKRFAISLSNDLASLGVWAKSRPTHAKIFQAAIRHMTKFGATADPYLYYKVMVVGRVSGGSNISTAMKGAGLVRAGVE